MLVLSPKRLSSITSLLLGTVCGFTLVSVMTVSTLILDEYFAEHVRYDEGEGLAELVNEEDSAVFHLAPEYRDQEVALELAKHVRVLCWVATIPSNHVPKAVHIRDTWGKRCNVLLFMSSMSDNALPAVVLDVKEGREHLFDKTKAAMVYVYKHYIDTIDWILKADDDTYVIVENLRYILSRYDPSQALYLGCRFKPFTKQGFMSGGAGYVLSRRALKLFVEEAMPDKDKCLQFGTGEGEDVQMGKCLESVNVTALDTRDKLGKERFFPYHPEFHLFPDHQSQAYDWYWNYQYYPNGEGLDCCSDTAVSFHYISPEQLHVLDYLVYSLRLHGSPTYYRQAERIVIQV